MTAIWLLSTRGRPRDAQATIDACQEAGMTSRGVVYVDEDTGLYNRLRLPKNWDMHREREWLSLQGSMSWCLRAFPDASHYGWLADDTRPRTFDWDRRLEAAAGAWCLSYAKDLWMSENKFDVWRLEQGKDLSSGLCWGGSLVRTVGWWALPGVRQAGIDTAWTDLISPLDLHRYTPSVTVEHLNWRTGKRPKDAMDDWETNFIEQDLKFKNEWCWSAAYRDKLTVLSTALGRPEMTPPVQLAWKLSLADEKLHRTGGVKNSVIAEINVLEREVDRYYAYQRDNPHQEQAPVDPTMPPVDAEPDVPGLGAHRL